MSTHGAGGTGSSSVDFGLALKRAQHLLGLRIDEVLRPLDLNLGLWAVMREVEKWPGASASELARASFHTPQTLSALLRRLEDRGIVERSEARGRVVDNHLTEAGRAALAEVTRRIEALIDDLLGKLDAEDRAAFIRLTNDFAGVLTPTTGAKRLV
jgi:DNA-binding MarR family transcriptional regulator